MLQAKPSSLSPKATKARAISSLGADRFSGRCPHVCGVSVMATKSMVFLLSALLLLGALVYVVLLFTAHPAEQQIPAKPVSEAEQAAQPAQLSDPKPHNGKKY